MKNYKILAAVAAALSLAACSDKASVNGVIEGAAKQQIIVKQLNLNVYNTLDTLTTKADGSFSYKIEVEKGQPESISSTETSALPVFFSRRATRFSSMPTPSASIA